MIYTDEELIQHLVRLSRSLGKVPSKGEMEDFKGAPSPSTYIVRFGSWNNALEKACLPTRNAKRCLSQQDVLNVFELFVEDHGRFPKEHEYPISRGTIQKLFPGSAKQIKALINYPRKKSHPVTVSRASIIDLYQQIGRTEEASITVRALGIPRSVIRKHFGNLRNLEREARLDEELTAK